MTNMRDAVDRALEERPSIEYQIAQAKSVAYSEGYNKGYEDGQLEGYDEGKAVGYREGRSAGLEADEAYDKGYSDAMLDVLVTLWRKEYYRR